MTWDFLRHHRFYRGICRLAAVLFLSTLASLHVLGQAPVQEPSGSRTLRLDPKDYGLDSKELLFQLGAAFETRDENCFAATGLVYITRPGLRFAFPVVGIENFVMFSRNESANAVTIVLTSNSCRYEVRITRYTSDGTEWKQSRLIDIPTSYNYGFDTKK